MDRDKTATDKTEAQDTSKLGIGKGIAIGVAIGAGIGVSLGNLVMGVGIGVALGVALGGLELKKQGVKKQAD